MLREARIVMPLAGDRLACKKVHDTLQRRLCEAFGGFTKFTGSGGCVDSRGNLISDANIIYDVAIDSERDSPTDLIARFAIEAGKALDQTSVYVRYPNGVADIIKIETKAETLARVLSEPRNDAADALSYAFIIVADMGDGRSAVEPETAPGTEEAKPAEDVKLAPGQLWTTRGGGRAAVGRRATIFGGGFYVTLVDNQPPSHRVGFEYAVTVSGHLIGPHHETMLDLVAHIH